MAVAFAGGAVVTRLASAGPEPAAASSFKRLRVLSRALAYIESSYVEPVGEQKLVYGAVRGMLQSLDPHSMFLSPQEFRELREDTEGEFTGVGIEIEVQDGLLTVIAPIEGSPAAAAGIKSGDKIVKINGVDAEGFSILDSAKRLRGKPGTDVTLTIERKGWKEPRDFKLTRAHIKLNTVEGRLVAPGYGVVRLRQFVEGAATETAAAVRKLEAENKAPLAGLVLDLRDNPGGLLDEGTGVADLFLSDGQVVSTRGRGGMMLDDVRAGSSEDVAVGVPLVVLINEGSASASEIVAGALQDRGRAAVLGTQSFGKGSVQTVIPLDDGSALKLTIARYYTPSGRSIQGRGITPDMVVEQLDADALKKARLGKSRGVAEADLPHSLKPESAPGSGAGASSGVATRNIDADFQLKTAVDHLKAARVLANPRKP
ncbi:MAG: S41 family peptidase [Deltaproteobacteria bacterium]|nr:S41 family peptidase [Deltaproteobacteria bacterium]